MYFESKVLNVQLKKAKVHYIPDVVYSQVPTFEKPIELLQMDILMPQSGAPLPAVIFVTGGGFISSNRARMPQLRMRLAESGYFVASINYRTTPNTNFPQPIEDVKSAIRFVKANAKRFNVNAEKVSVIGDSAGGYLTSFVAVTNDAKIFNTGDYGNISNKIVAAVDLYGISDLTKIADDFNDEIKKNYNSSGSIASLFVNGMAGFTGRGGSIVDDEKIAAATNPINYIHKDSAPMLLMHGTDDHVVSASQTDLLFQALRNNGIDAERYLVPNADHSDDFWVQDEVFDVIVEFLNRYSK